MGRKKKSELEEPVTRIIIDLPEGEDPAEEELQEEQVGDETPAPRERKPIEVRAAMLKDEMFCHYTYDHTVAANTTNEVKCKSAVPIHKHLAGAFDRLNPHFAVICEEIAANAIEDIDKITGDPGDPLIDKLAIFSVASFRLDGMDVQEGVYLVGFKKLSTGDQIEMKPPKIRWDSSYAFVHELRMAIMDLIHEVELYMGGKQAPKQQLSIDFDDSEVNTGTAKKAAKVLSKTAIGSKMPFADPEAMARVAAMDNETN